jgi:OOP family OmpA-OmpF porin
MRKVLPFIALAFGAGVAQADNGLLYVGAGVSRDSLRDIAATNGNLDSTDWKVWAGLRPISLLGIEADYLDLGSQTLNSNFVSGSSSTHLAYKAFAGYAVGFLPIPVPFLDVFGKAGLARWNSSGGSSIPGGPFFSLSDEGTQFAWGIGAQVHVGNFGGRLEYENFSIRNTNGANIVSLSVFLNLF